VSCSEERGKGSLAPVGGATRSGWFGLTSGIVFLITGPALDRRKGERFRWGEGRETNSERKAPRKGIVRTSVGGLKKDGGENFSTLYS